MSKHTALSFSKALKSLLEVPAQIAKDVAKDISKDIQANFDAGQDAYKRPWTKLAKATLAKGRHPPPLTDTRKGRRGIKVLPAQGAGISITSSVGYMGIHQHGSPPRLPRRSFLPTNTMPKAWHASYQKHLTKKVKEKLGRGK